MVSLIMKPPPPGHGDNRSHRHPARASEKPTAHKPCRGYSPGHSFCLFGKHPSQLSAQYRNFGQEVKRGFPNVLTASPHDNCSGGLRPPDRRSGKQCLPSTAVTANWPTTSRRLAQSFSTLRTDVQRMCRCKIASTLNRRATPPRAVHHPGPLHTASRRRRRTIPRTTRRRRLRGAHRTPAAASAPAARRPAP